MSARTRVFFKACCLHFTGHVKKMPAPKQGLHLARRTQVFRRRPASNSFRISSGRCSFGQPRDRFTNPNGPSTQDGEVVETAVQTGSKGFALSASGFQGYAGYGGYADAPLERGPGALKAMIRIERWPKPLLANFMWVHMDHCKIQPAWQRCQPDSFPTTNDLK